MNIKRVQVSGTCDSITVPADISMIYFKNVGGTVIYIMMDPNESIDYVAINPNERFGPIDKLTASTTFYFKTTILGTSFVEIVYC
jgi:hypothetical protein